MREVLKFKDNNIEYLLLVQKGKLIPAKKINQELIYDLDDAEILLIKQVFSKVMPTNKVVNLGILNKFNKQFNHYYDYLNHYHLFWEQNKIPSLTDFIKLNIIYNNELEYDLIDDVKKRAKNKKIERIIYQGTKALVVILSIVDIYFFVNFGSVIYQNLESFYVNPALNKIEEVLDIAYANPLTNTDVINYLKKNPNLNNEEKAYLTSFSDFFTDELPYIDRRDLIDNLENLNPIYYPEKNEEMRGAWFNSGEDIFKIKIWESQSTDQFLAETDKYVLRHEFFHAWSQKTGPKLAIGNYLYEFLNHTLSNEYAYVLPNETEYDNSYTELENYGRVFFELIDADVLREFHVTKNLNLLITELKKIIPNEESAYQLIAQMDEYYQAKREHVNDKEDQEKAEAFQEADNHLKNLLTLYWERKYNQKITEDWYIYFLLNPQDAFPQIKEKFPDYQIAYITFEKAYFNPRLDSTKKIKLKLTDNKEIVINDAGELILDEENGLKR